MVTMEMEVNKDGSITDAWETTTDGDTKRYHDDAKETGIWTDRHSLIFDVDSNPPLYISIAFAVQQLFNTIPGCVMMVLLLSSFLCADKSPEFGHMISAMMSSAIFVAGVATWMQTTLGVRLPIVQGSSFSFIAPIVAMMSIEKWKCVNGDPSSTGLGSFDTMFNGTSSAPLVETEARILARISELSGGFILASLFQTFVGAFGLVGVTMKYIGPLTIIPTIALVGLSMAGVATKNCQSSWIVSAIGICVTCFFSLVINKTLVYLPAYTKKRGVHLKSYPIFQLFAPFFSISLMWLLCYVLTKVDYFPDDPSSPSYRSRTDNNLEVIDKADWFYVPYPGQFGWPTFGAGAFAGFMTSTFASIIESVGDYYATARICSLPPPPRHAFNRGISLEGLCSVLGGHMGLCHGTTSYSGVIGVIGITGNGSRHTWQIIGILLMLCGLFGKFGAFLTIVPAPIIGANIVVGLGMVISVALTNITLIDLRLPRNMMVLGISLMLGLMMPTWSTDNPDAIDTGYVNLNQVLTILLRTPMFVGGAVGFIMDNILPGDLRSRGLLPEKEDDQHRQHVTEKRRAEVYDVMGVGRHYETRDAGWLKWIPFLPMFDVVKRDIDNEATIGGVADGLGGGVTSSMMSPRRRGLVEDPNS